MSHNYEVSATPCGESEAERRPSGGVAETLLHETAVSESGYGDLAELLPRANGIRRVGTRREALYEGELAFRWRGSSGGLGISHHVGPGQDEMSVSRPCDTVAGAFSGACRY